MPKTWRRAAQGERAAASPQSWVSPEIALVTPLEMPSCLDLGLAPKLLGLKHGPRCPSVHGRARLVAKRPSSENMCLHRDSEGAATGLH